jgi:hypothetical protein
LKALPQVAVKSWLPPLPFPAASEGYAAKFNRFMSGAGTGAQSQASAHGGLHLLEAQTLRDASMAYAVSEYLRRGREPLVVQVNGNFHSEERMGVPEQLAHYRPRARAVVVTITPADAFPDFDPAQGRLGDFVIITGPAVKGP